MQASSLIVTDKSKHQRKAPSKCHALTVNKRPIGKNRVSDMRGGTGIPRLAFWQKHHYQTGTHCVYCGKPFNKKRYKTKVHIMPVALGGKNEVMNYVAACIYCNQEKSNMLLIQFIGHLERNFDRRAKNAWKLYNKTSKARE